MALSERQLRGQWRLMTGLKHGTLLRIVRRNSFFARVGIALLFAVMLAMVTNASLGTGTPIHFSDLFIDFVLAFRRRDNSATSFERRASEVGRGRDL